MIKLTLTKEDKSKIDILLIDGVGQKDKIINFIYPDKGIRDLSKGYIELVNFLFGDKK